MDIDALAEPLDQAAEHHERLDGIAPRQHWFAVYTAYVAARDRGSAPDEALAAAARHA